MTDDARTTHEANDAEGRTPSDFADGGHGTPESRRADSSGPEFSRPEFLPAGEAAPFQAEQPRDDGWSQPGAQPDRDRWGRPQEHPEPLRHDGRDVPPGEGVQGPGPTGENWGDPSGRPRYDTAVFSSQPAPPPPPAQAFGMGPGWAPPPTGPGGPGGPGGFGGPPPAPVRRGPRTATLVILAVVVALLASTLGSVGTYLLTKPTGSGRDPSFSLGGAPTGSNVRPPESVAGVASKVLPSVVSLAVEGGASSSTGSGFLIKGGYVVTNNHVVASADPSGQIQIQFNNRKSTSAVVVGRDPESDLAVVKPAETFGAPEIVLGNSDNVVVGDPVIAIGSPLGLTGTVTSGIVSSLNRPVQAGEENSSDTTWLSAVQTDAAINPGNSGGPLVNVNGEVIGVNSAIATLGRSVGGQSGSIGLGFAIPVNHARRVAQELITTGKAKKSRIGVAIDPTYQGVGVRIATESRQGSQPVEPNGPAAQAGLKPGDVILEVEGVVLQDGNELIAMIRNRAPGEKLAIKYQRGGQEKTATVTVGTAPDQPSPAPS
ncbi:MULTISPECIES: S1C family serine protease [unclassified Streptosporangium]|uniref:S1C family serine protease n=1 Tax=unclassified Streptosporangium TaxID=2632669 RepID=UPI002E283A5B|nr:MULTISPECIES: trypsin-like peptidase domain-containing protein [unclassified Streptosporangium]